MLGVGTPFGGTGPTDHEQVLAEGGCLHRPQVTASIGLLRRVVTVASVRPRPLLHLLLHRTRLAAGQLLGLDWRRNVLVVQALIQTGRPVRGVVERTHHSGRRGGDVVPVGRALLLVRVHVLLLQLPTLRVAVTDRALVHCAFGEVSCMLGLPRTRLRLLLKRTVE